MSLFNCSSRSAKCDPMTLSRFGSTRPLMSASFFRHSRLDGPAADGEVAAPTLPRDEQSRMPTKRHPNKQERCRPISFCRAHQKRTATRPNSRSQRRVAGLRYRAKWLLRPAASFPETAIRTACVSFEPNRWRGRRSRLGELCDHFQYRNKRRSGFEQGTEHNAITPKKSTLVLGKNVPVLRYDRPIPLN
jgi:hypothetical protein